MGISIGYMLPNNKIIRSVVFLGLIGLCSCELITRDAPSLVVPVLQRSEIFGFLAGMGTTFAALPDLIAMLRRRSTVGMNPRMAAIMGAFQILWVYYGLLIVSRPVIAWNLLAVVINFMSVAAYLHFSRIEKKAVREGRHTLSPSSSTSAERGA